MKNKNGFVLVINLILCSLFIVVLTLSACLYFCILHQEQNQHLCQKNLLEVQTSISQGIKKLFHLNPKASLLLTQEANALKKLQLAILSENPVVIAAATAHLSKIKMEQESLGKTQKLIITETMNIVELQLQKYKQSFYSQNHSIKYKNLYITKPNLAIKGIPSFAVAPIYKTQEPFTELQKIEAWWQVSTFDLLPPIIKMNFIENKKFNFACGTSLKGADHLWQPRLIKAKS